MKNFGKIKNTFNEILVESLLKKDRTKKELFKQYFKLIKENKILKAQFLVYNNIENKIEENEQKAYQFIQENIEFLKQFKKKDIQEANEKLAKSIVLEQGINHLYTNESLHENITKLIFTDKTPKNIDTIIESQSQIVDYIKNNKKKELTENISKDIPNSMLSKLLVDIFNERYIDLSEDDKKIFKTVLDGTEESKKDLHENTIKECIILIDNKLNESDLEVKEKLLKAKDKLLNMKGNFINEDFINNISKLIELKKDLSI